MTCHFWLTKHWVFMNIRVPTTRTCRSVDFCIMRTCTGNWSTALSDCTANICWKFRVLIIFVFYNGSEKDLAEERRILRLSDAFETDTGAGEYEWTATMININSGKNQSIMDSCHVLYEYAVFVAKIKKYRDSMELKEAIDLTVRECIEEDILRDFLEQHVLVPYFASGIVP